MLAYISIGIALSNIAVGLVFALTWLYFYEEMHHSSLLENEFHSTVRRMIVSIGIFAIPVVLYFLDHKNLSGNKAEPYAFVWVACCVGSLLFLAVGSIILIRDARREKKTGLYRFRR
jgi:hypothetical protein